MSNCDRFRLFELISQHRYLTVLPFPAIFSVFLLLDKIQSTPTLTSLFWSVTVLDNDVIYSD